MNPVIQPGNPGAKKHPQWRALATLDRWLIEQHTVHLAPRYKKLSLQCIGSWRQNGDIPSVMRTYDAGMPAIKEKHRELVHTALTVAGIIGERAFARELFDRYPTSLVQSLDLTAATPEEIAKDIVPLPAEVKLGGGLTEEQVRAYMNARDPWGMTYSERIWKADADTRAGLTRALEDHLRSGRAVLSDTQALKQFQLQDPTLPKYLDDLKRKATAAFSGDADAKIDFLKLLAKAKTQAGTLKKSPLGTQGYTNTFLKQLERAVKRGETALAEGAITTYIDKRANYRAAVLLRSEGVRASQFTTWEKYKKQDFVLAIQWNLSGSHKRLDECDFKAGVDIGLGPGVYYKESIPWPDHPNGICFLTSVLPDAKDLGTAVPYQPSDPEAYGQLINDIKTGPITKEINKLGARTEPPLDDIQRLIGSMPKIPPLGKEAA